MTRPLLMLMALIVLPLMPALAQEPEEPEGITEDEDRARIESADHLRYDPVEGMYYLDGNVVFSHKEIKLYCDEAVYDYDANSAVAKGNPRVVDPETTITGDLIEANFYDEVATITGNVTAVTQKQQDSTEQPAESEEETDEDAPPRDLEELWEDQTTITCEKIVYQYGEDVEVVTATGRVKAVQEDKTAYADTAVYEEKKDLITLTGDVRIVTDRGDEFRCPRAVISTEEDWIQAEQVTGVGRRRDHDEDAESPPATEQAAPVQESDGAEAPPPDQ